MVRRANPRIQKPKHDGLGVLVGGSLGPAFKGSRLLSPKHGQELHHNGRNFPKVCIVLSRGMQEWVPIIVSTYIPYTDPPL